MSPYSCAAVRFRYLAHLDPGQYIAVIVQGLDPAPNRKVAERKDIRALEERRGREIAETGFESAADRYDRE